MAADIQEIISKIAPDATFETGTDNILTITVSDAHWHETARTLRDDPALAFDFLVTIVGMDWKDSLGCIYYLTSTKRNVTIAVKVSTTDRKNPMLHSISDLWSIAGILWILCWSHFCQSDWSDNPDAGNTGDCNVKRIDRGAYRHRRLPGRPAETARHDYNIGKRRAAPVFGCRFPCRKIFRAF